MDWAAYKELCQRPDCWSRWMLEQSLELLSGAPALARPLRLALDGTPLAKPPGHRGGAETDMLRLELDGATVQAIVAVVEQAVAQGKRTSGTQDRGLGGFVEAWRECGEFVNQSGPR